MKKLIIRKETLRSLDTTRLRRAGGGFVLTGNETYTCPTTPVTQCKCQVQTLRGCTTGIECP